MWTRRTFLSKSTALSAGALAGRGATLDAVARAGETSAAQTPDAAARDEGFWGSVQDAFAIARAPVNLNNGATSPSPRLVQEAFSRHIEGANRELLAYGPLLAERVEQARRGLASEFGCDPDEVALTRNTTEALHIAQSGIDLRRGDEVVTTDHDYPRMLWMWHQRARRDGIVVTRIQFPVPAVAAELVARVEAALTPRTRVLHVCHMTNVTGQVFPVRELSRLARDRGIVTIVDGAQTAGHIPVNLRELGCDVFGTSLHKWLMAPQGTGFLYVRRERIERLWPLQASTEGMAASIGKFEESGTQSLAARAALVEALEFHRTLGGDRKAARLRHLTMRWVDALRGHPRVRLLSSVDADQTWGLATAAIDGVNGAALARELLARGIAVGSVVSQGIPGPVFPFSGIRVTPQVYTTPEEIDRFAATLRQLLS